MLHRSLPSVEGYRQFLLAIEGFFNGVKLGIRDAAKGFSQLAKLFKCSIGFAVGNGFIAGIFPHFTGELGYRLGEPTAKKIGDRQ